MRSTTFLSILAVTTAAWTVLGEDPQEKLPDNIGHARHLYRRNASHPTMATDPARFVTSRTGATLLLPQEEDAFTFVVFGDRTGGPADGVAVLADAVRDTNLLEPDFVMTVGDLVQGYNTNDVWLRQMHEFKGIMSHLICPWFPVAGNHDVYWRGAKGEKPPVGEHEVEYEMHFGPLWYAFKHKNCWFIALYSDEGNPDTGEKAIKKPECQRMSPAQFEWLEQTLEKAKDADHVFCFLHHPRWLGGNYGDDWRRVHALLKRAGNVSAVFAGHIHRMHYANTDGIEYVTLATVGGGQDGIVPAAGFLHQFHVVNVRKNQIAIASVPVGEVMDVRDITEAVQNECIALHQLAPRFETIAQVKHNGACNGPMTVVVRNPATRDIEVTASLVSADSRWVVGPDHAHHVIGPGEEYLYYFHVQRDRETLDAGFRPLELMLDIEYLTESSRYPLPSRRIEAPLDIDFSLPQPEAESVLRLNGKDAYVEVPSSALVVPDGPFTLECWFQAEAYQGRTGLVTKTEGSEFGIFVNDGRPAFSVHLDGDYVGVRGKKGALPVHQWQHIAGVYDGDELRLYVNGELIQREAATGHRKPNALPLVVGADVTRSGGATSHFHGELDEVRISTIARYEGQSFAPSRRFEADEHTSLLLHMDGVVGPWTPDASARGANGKLMRDARVESLTPARSSAQLLQQEIEPPSRR